MAAHTGGQAALEWLLAHGADVNVRVKTTGNTALHQVIKSATGAVRSKGPQMVAALLNAGARVDLPNRQNITALALARSVNRQNLNASQMLRTLEVNCGAWHGTIGVEEV
jgi:ankyrin repeat protein